MFTVQGRLAWGHKLEIYNAQGGYVGRIEEQIFTFLPRFALYMGDTEIGEIKKELTFFKPQYTLNCNGWSVQGDMWGWNYQVMTPQNSLVATVGKQLFNWTDTYVIDVTYPQDAIMALMIVLAIDAANCSSND